MAKYEPWNIDYSDPRQFQAMMDQRKAQAVPYSNDVSKGHFSEIDDGYGHVDEVEAHWLWIFSFGFLLGGAITSAVWYVW